MKILFAALAVAALASTAPAEDWQCGWPVCMARITVDGELQEVYLRQGDMVSTDAGWSVTSEEGWVKVGGKPLNRPKRLWGNGAVRRVLYVVSFFGVVDGGYSPHMPTAFGSVATGPLIPVDISLIGL